MAYIGKQNRKLYTRSKLFDIALLPVLWGACAFILLFSCRPAIAGWDVVIPATGTTKSGSQSPVPFSTTSNPTNSVRKELIGNGGNIEITGVVHLKWSGGGTPTPPPNSVKITSKAIAESSISVPSASNGQGDTATLSGSGTFADKYVRTSAGSHLIKVPSISSGTTDVTIATVAVTASYQGAGGTASISISAVADSRSVYLNR